MPQSSVRSFRRWSHTTHAVMAASKPIGSAAARNLAGRTSLPVDYLKKAYCFTIKLLLYPPSHNHTGAQSCKMTVQACRSAILAIL